MSINVIGKYVLNPANMTLYIKNENAKINNGNIEIFHMINRLFHSERFSNFEYEGFLHLYRATDVCNQVEEYKWSTIW